MTFDELTELMVGTRDLRQEVGEAMAYNTMGHKVIARQKGLDAVRRLEAMIAKTKGNGPKKRMALSMLDHLRFVSGDHIEYPSLSVQEAYEAGRADAAAGSKKKKKKAKKSKVTHLPPASPRRKAKKKTTTKKKKADYIRGKYTK